MITDVRALARALRIHAVEMTASAHSSHVGSMLSVADILAVLYGRVARYDAEKPDAPGRDRVILSKGHAAAAVYAVLAESGYFPVADLATYYANGSLLAGHVSHVGIPGVELSTGSLGHGLPVAAGMALAAKRRNLGFRTYVLMSDGECDEGSVWEAAMFAAHHKLADLCAVIDYNELQSITSTHETLELEPFADKWVAFGWQVQEVDGHDLDALEAALVDRRPDPVRPRCVIAHTVKGRGISFMENSILWHYRSPAGDELVAALAELRGTPVNGVR